MVPDSSHQKANIHWLDQKRKSNWMGPMLFFSRKALTDMPLPICYLTFAVMKFKVGAKNAIADLPL